MSPARQVNSHRDHDPAASPVDVKICTECGVRNLRSLMLPVFLDSLVLVSSNVFFTLNRRHLQIDYE